MRVKFIPNLRKLGPLIATLLLIVAPSTGFTCDSRKSFQWAHPKWVEYNGTYADSMDSARLESEIVGKAVRFLCLSKIVPIKEPLLTRGRRQLKREICLPLNLKEQANDLLTISLKIIPPIPTEEEFSINVLPSVDGSYLKMISTQWQAEDAIKYPPRTVSPSKRTYVYLETKTLRMLSPNVLLPQPLREQLFEFTVNRILGPLRGTAYEEIYVERYNKKWFSELLDSHQIVDFRQSEIRIDLLGTELYPVGSLFREPKILWPCITD